MRKFISLFLFLFFIIKETKADCNPAFTANVQGPTVQLQATNTAPHLFHWWNLNGLLLSGATASHTYPIPGTYTITHHVDDSLGNCVDSTQQTVVVNFQVSCTANFTAVRDTIQPFVYHFNSTSVSSGGSSQIFWNEWSIDGVTVGHGTSFDYTLYTGNYIVCLNILTLGGCASTACDTIQVWPPPCTLNASFTYTAASNPKQISFTASPSSTTGVYSWLFGDGNTSTQQNPTHIYAQAGSYDVILRIYNFPCYDTIIQNIVVHGLPSDSCYAFFIQSADPARPNEITFIAASNQTITSQRWVISNLNSHDSVVINTNDPTYLFTATGHYFVCLGITTNSGCTREYCDIINIDSIWGRPSERIPCYPNPVRTSVAFRLRVTENKRVKISIYNLSGYALYQTERNCIRGTNEIILPVQTLTAGQYFIDIKYGDQQKRSIFQKL